MITVVAGGDSFVFGAELKDQFGNLPSMSTYPALLTKDLNLDYICVAYSGNSNSGIARMTINACEQHKDKNLIAFVTWTFSSRYEFHFNYKVRNQSNNWYSLTPWDAHESLDEIKETIKSNNDILLNHMNHFNKLNSTGIGAFSKEFYKHVGDNEVYETYSSLKEIVFLQQYLKLNNIPYMFTCVDANIFNHSELTQTNLDIKNLRSQIDMDKWFLFDPAPEPFNTQTPRGFYQWAIENKYPVGTTHPLEPAHADAAKLMKEKFNEMVKKSVQ